VDYHLERGLRLHTEPEYKNLYSWAILEVDAQGKQIGYDQIPWPWSLYFTATSCVLGDSIEIETWLQGDETAPVPPKIAQDQHIRVQLRPGDARRDGVFTRETKFSMFGTGRVIKSFILFIYPIADPAKQESCIAWGSVSYTSEGGDFRRKTMDDCIEFSLYVKPDTFARYAAKIAYGLVDEMIFRVSSVAGFYSEWSPSISTDSVKVLTDGDEQKITLPATSPEAKPPRLGHVREADLYINRRLEFGKQAPEPEADEEMSDVGTEPETQAPPAIDPRMLQMLGSLKSAAWFVVWLLALIFILTLLKR
jgi:hypothetical protein